MMALAIRLFPAVLRGPAEESLRRGWLEGVTAASTPRLAAPRIIEWGSPVVGVPELAKRVGREAPPAWAPRSRSVLGATALPAHRHGHLRPRTATLLRPPAAWISPRATTTSTWNPTRALDRIMGHGVERRAHAPSPASFRKGVFRGPRSWWKRQGPC